jgi:catechol 2,3-dioxygenase-like lactoylglutathione lyase family enzyme
MNPFKPGHLVVVSIDTADLATSTHFYRDVIGLQLIPDHGDRPALDLGGGCYLVLVEHQAPKRDRPHFPVLAFAVDDLEAARAHLQAHGVALPWPVEHSHTAKWILFPDPDGNLIEFAQFSQPPHQ